MWDRLIAHEAATRERRIADLCDGARAEDFSIRVGDMLFDYSKTNIDAEARDMLVGLLDTTGVAAKRAAMFGGEKINATEGRAVLHTALAGADGGLCERGPQREVPRGGRCGGRCGQHRDRGV